MWHRGHVAMVYSECHSGGSWGDELGPSARQIEPSQATKLMGGASSKLWVGLTLLGGVRGKYCFRVARYVGSWGR